MSDFWDSEVIFIKKRDIWIFSVCYLVYTSVYIARINLSVATPEFQQQGIMSAAQIGILSGAFSIIYSVGRLVNGMISDKAPPWTMVCTGLLVAGISNIGFSFLPPLVGCVLLWGANAYAQSMLWSSLLCVFAETFDQKILGKATSYLVTSVATGNVISILLNTLIITKLGVRFAFIVPGGITIALGVLALFTLKNIKPKSQKVKKHIPVIKLFKEKRVSISIIPAMLHGVIKDNITVWMTAFFVFKYEIDLKASAFFVLAIPIVGLVGRLAYPLCYRLTKYNENMVSEIGFAVCAICSGLMCISSNPPVLAAIYLSLIYAAVSLVNTSFLSILPLHFAATSNVASVSGIMDFSTYLGAGIGSFVFGFIIDKFGYGQMYLSWAIISLISMGILSSLIKLGRKKPLE